MMEVGEWEEDEGEGRGSGGSYEGNCTVKRCVATVGAPVSRLFSDLPTEGDRWNRESFRETKTGRVDRALTSAVYRGKHGRGRCVKEGEL